MMGGKDGQINFLDNSLLDANTNYTHCMILPHTPGKKIILNIYYIVQESQKKAFFDTVAQLSFGSENPVVRLARASYYHIDLCWYNFPLQRQDRH